VTSFEALLSREGLAWMGQNTTHLEPPAEVVAALRDSTQRREFQFYAPALGFERLRELILDDLGLAGGDAVAMITDGAVGGLHHVCTALAAGLSRLITTYSFSKWLGLAGLRVGAVVGTPGLMGTLTEVPSNPLGASITAQRAAIAGLEVKGPWLSRLRAVNAANQQIVGDAVTVSGLGRVLVRPSHGNFLAVDIGGSGWTADGLCAAMLERDVFIRPGTYQSPLFGERFVKVSTSVPPDWAQRFSAAWSAVVAGEVPR